jgi:Rrf2 family protein
MNISSRCEYACRAIIELARNDAGEPLTATVIAERRTIPEQYLVHILLQLKRAGLVRSVRGARGGYLLAKSTDEITLRDIVAAIDGPVIDPLPVGGSGSEELGPVWREVAAGVDDVLSRVTLRSLLQTAPQADMYYI